MSLLAVLNRKGILMSLLRIQKMFIFFLPSNPQTNLIGFKVGRRD